MFIEQMEINTSHVITSVSASWALIHGFAEMYRRDKAQRLQVRARSGLRDAALRDHVRAQTVSSAAARQAGRPKTRMVAFGHATEKVAGFLALPCDPRRHMNGGV